MAEVLIVAQQERPPALVDVAQAELVEAALARTSPHDPRVAERFELYACGVELANGFGELTDAGEQRRRFAAAMDDRERIYGDRYPIDEDFLAALAVMPAASGVALGLDRLVMLATGAPHIDLVQWTPAIAAGAEKPDE
jgi:lysyl-tRNA synthetase class 2